jgi:hypothetical protein
VPANWDIRHAEQLAWLLDESVRLPGGYRIGLDGILGLIPGDGDMLTMGVSGYLVVIAHRLGAPKRVLARMVSNVLVDTILGAVPLVGDVFDFGWKSNTRNLALLKRHLE